MTCRNDRTSDLQFRSAQPVAKFIRDQVDHMPLSGAPHIVVTIEADLHRPAGFVSRTDSLSNVTENGYIGVEGDKKIGDMLPDIIGTRMSSPHVNMVALMRHRTTINNHRLACHEIAFR